MSRRETEKSPGAPKPDSVQELSDEALDHVAGGSDELPADLQSQLQQQMDRHSPSSQLASNILKRSGETQQAVIRKIG